MGEGEKIAHVRPELEGGHAIHLLEDHLRETGRLAGGFASEFGNEDWAHLAGGPHSGPFENVYSPQFSNSLLENSRCWESRS